jgi:hypothetical protein
MKQAAATAAATGEVVVAVDEMPDLGEQLPREARSGHLGEIQGRNGQTT